MKLNKIFLSFIFVCVVSVVSAQQDITLKILQTSDTHSRIEPIELKSADRHAGMGGFVRRATAINEMRKQDRKSVV